jgi:hypothetical protein
MTIKDVQCDEIVRMLPYVAALSYNWLETYATLLQRSTSFAMMEFPSDSSAPSAESPLSSSSANESILPELPIDSM